MSVMLFGFTCSLVVCSLGFQGQDPCLGAAELETNVIVGVISRAGLSLKACLL